MKEKTHQTWNGQELDGFAHRSYLRFKFGINKHDPAHSVLPVPQQEPEVRGAVSGGECLGKTG